MSFKRITALFCIVSLTVFQLAVVTSFAECCCTVKQQPETQQTDIPEASSCCSVKPNQEEAASSPNKSHECLSLHSELNLCACDHEHTPVQVDERQVVLPNPSKHEQTVSIRLIPVCLPNQVDGIAQYFSRSQVYFPLSILALKSVVIRV